MTRATILQPPELAHDKMMLARFGDRVQANGRLERRIVWNLIEHLRARGLTVYAVHDYEEETPVADAKAAMELVFNLDGCNLHVKGKHGDIHCLVLVLGNGVDIVSDWFIPRDDVDGFDNAMNAFDAEQYA